MLLVRAILLATLAVFVHCDLELKLLHVLFRHGDKVPHREYQNYPNDPHRNHSYYPIDNGGLTNQGLLREYKIGTILRERYNQFLGPAYQPSMVYARSTEIPRTQMSLQLVLAGLYPPSDAQIWNQHLLWLPTSTFSVPYKEDQLLFPQYCPRYQEQLKELLNDDDVKKIMSKYTETLEYLTQHTGKPINSASDVYYLYNLMKEQAAQNLTLPEWTQKVYPNPMKEITALNFQLTSYTKELRRLNGGILLRKITDDMKDLRNGTLSPPERKVFLFGAHELNVAALASTLGTHDPVIPLFGSTIILETLRDKSDKYFVKVLLWTGVTERLIMQKIPGCTETCPLEDFLGLLKDVTPNDDEYKCNPPGKQSERQKKALSSERSTSFTSFTSAAENSRRTSGYWQLAFAVALISSFSVN